MVVNILFMKCWNFTNHQFFMNFKNQEYLIVLELRIVIVIGGLLVLVLEFVIELVFDDYFACMCLKRTSSSIYFVVIYDTNVNRLQEL